MHKSKRELVQLVQEFAHPLQKLQGDYGPVLHLLSDKSIILLGEATHGTLEFYQARVDICKQLIVHQVLHAIAIEGDWPYLWLDATYVKVREAGRIVPVAVTIAVGVNGDGRREVLGMAVGASEAETFWLDFLRPLARRGLRGVKLVISDAHEGLKAAVTKVLRATWPDLEATEEAAPWR